MKKCPTCKIKKEPKFFTKDKTKKDGLYAICKACRKRRRKERYEKDYETMKEKIKNMTGGIYIIKDIFPHIIINVRTVKPAIGGIVVMGTRVNNNVPVFIVMRKVIVTIGEIKRKLEDLHSRQLNIISQLLNFRSYLSQVLCNKRQITQLFLYTFEKSNSRTFDPFTLYSSRFFSRNRPVGLQRPKMIYPDQIHKPVKMLETVGPPLHS